MTTQNNRIIHIGDKYCLEFQKEVKNTFLSFKLKNYK